MNTDKRKISRSTLLNIDSEYRNLYPKNIYVSNGKVLPNNPLTLTTNSNIVTINYPNHGLLVNNNIAIQNVVGLSKVLSNSFHLINQFKYVLIVFNNNNLNSSYANININAMIELIGNQTENNIMNNITFNDIIGFKQTLLASNIAATYLGTVETTVRSLLTSVYNKTFVSSEEYLNYLNTNCLFVQLPQEYLNRNVSYYTVNQVFKINYQHIGGIQLGYLNANYPISNIYYQSNYQVYSVVDSNTFQISLNYKSYGNIVGGGKNVQVMKIINTETGYPDAGSYVINLKKTFNNVTKIELVSSEFPYVDIIIKKDINDKLYWKHIEDGQNVYSVQIEEGFYNHENLIAKLLEKINLVPRINNSQVYPLYNHFDIILETNIQKITFKPYNLNHLPNGLSLRLETINSVLYYILTIKQIGNLIELNDNITISNSNSVSLQNPSAGTSEYLTIDANYINKTFAIYNVDSANQSYDVIIGPQNEITETASDKTFNGGDNIIVKTSTKASMLFNYTDTMGGVLGFLNVGLLNSVIDFSSEISNKSNYVNSTKIDSVGNSLNYLSGFINFSGKYNYILMYLNDIEYIYSNNLPSAFAKILLNGNPGDLLFNTFVPNPENIYSKNFPISQLSQLTINFLYPDGSQVNFRNMNHSFTLRIVEEYVINNNMNLNSQNITFIEEMNK